MADVPVTRFVELVGPADANHHGTLFGGAALALLATAGAIAASRHSRRQVMVVRSDRVSFRAPVPVGSLVDLAAPGRRDATAARCRSRSRWSSRTP